MKKVILANLVVLGVALLIGLVILEVYLRFDGRYADLVNENLETSRAIFDRPANATQNRAHPDLAYDVEIIFNDFRARAHDGLTLDDVNADGVVNIGVFGDSFTENRRIEDRFTDRKSVV